MRQCSAFKTHYYMILFPQHIGIIAIFAPFSAFCALYCAHPPGLYMEKTGGGCVESRHERVPLHPVRLPPWLRHLLFLILWTFGLGWFLWSPPVFLNWMTGDGVGWGCGSVITSSLPMPCQSETWVKYTSTKLALIVTYLYSKNLMPEQWSKHFSKCSAPHTHHKHQQNVVKINFFSNLS